MFGFLKRHKIRNQEQPDKKDDKSSKNENITKDPVPSSILQCEKLVKSIMGHSGDIIIQSTDTQKERAMLVYIDGLVNKDLMDRDIISPLKSKDFDGDIKIALKTHYKEATDMTTFVNEVVQGQFEFKYNKRTI